MIFKQLKVRGLDANFSYIIADEKTREGMVVDPCGCVQTILESINKNGLKVKYIVNTHAHTDHTEGNEAVSRNTQAKVVCHKLEASSIKPDIAIEDEDTLKLGDLSVKVIHTPGHTPGSICLLVENKILVTGDTLFVGYCGRTDFPGGSSEALYHSLFHRIANLPDDTEIYPGHDYGKKPCSTLSYEKSHNPYYLCQSKDEFIKLRARGV